VTSTPADRNELEVRPTRNNKNGRCVLAAKQSPHRPGISRTAGLRARSDGVSFYCGPAHLD